MTKEKLKKKRIRNILIKTSIVLVALILTFIYENYSKEKSEEATGQKKEDAISAMGDISESPPIKDESVKVDSKQKELVVDLEDTVDKKEENESENESKEVDSVEKASASIADSYREHGENAVLKSSDELTEAELATQKYPLVEPDFSNLHPINFRGLKKVYTYFRVKESLPEVVVKKLNGAAVVMTGAVMPVAEIPEDGKFQAFWLSNPSIVLAGCVFCNPPTLADIVYVYKDAGEIPFKVDREKLFKQVVLVRVIGRLYFGPEKRGDQTFLFSIQSSDIKILN
jgi:hypothetical protein